MGYSLIKSEIQSQIAKLKLKYKNNYGQLF